MAQYTITHQCGHQQTHQIYGTNSHGERERYANRLAARICDDCRHAAEQRQQDDLLDRARQVSADWPELTGSPRQIAWATNVRAVAVAALVDSVAKTLGEQAVQDEVLRPLIGALLAQTAASWWIDRRHLARPISSLADMVEAPGIARHRYGHLLEVAIGLLGDDERAGVAAALGVG